ncbi:Hypothetical protein SCLAV_p0617 (plasmid) [Streptomyces clavuligerus]|uniref:Uncharacterized protein n=1 Tax=Streptomyces clavuligerus TaxID=1901 RepID=B5GTN6_STRCL|nr:hypothetical protein SSCG_02784 [Streptomyces clavuligerus]EFG04104.1 Hypothetical protein SCLAV_p0617 [Streptomyces clavuligerus]
MRPAGRASTAECAAPLRTARADTLRLTLIMYGGVTDMAGDDDISG